jgi:hypothetical protein
LPMRSAASSHGVVARRSAKPPILPGVVHSASRRAVQQTLQPPPALETEKREDRAGEWQVLQIVRTDEPESPALTVVRRGPQQDAAAAASVSSSSENDDSTMAPQQTAAANPGQKLLAGARSLFVPDGWPASTTPDYMPYQLWALPTHGGCGSGPHQGGRPLVTTREAVTSSSKTYCCGLLASTHLQHRHWYLWLVHRPATSVKELTLMMLFLSGMQSSDPCSTP